MSSDVNVTTQQRNNTLDITYHTYGRWWALVMTELMKPTTISSPTISILPSTIPVKCYGLAVVTTDLRP